MLTKKETAIKIVKGTLGFGTGLGLSSCFILYMDEMIYADARKHIVMSLAMNKVRGSSDNSDRLSKLL